MDKSNWTAKQWEDYWDDDVSPEDADKIAKSVNRDEDWRPKVYTPNAGMDSYGKRKGPKQEIRDRLLRRHHNRCAYCNLKFGTTVKVRGKTVRVRIHWDHFVPYSWSLRNEDSNWLPSCEQCNLIKGDLVFETMNSARKFVIDRRRAKLYNPIHRYHWNDSRIAHL